MTRVPVENTSIYIQAGAFQNQDNARSLTGRLGAAFSGAHIQQTDVDGRTFYRVRIGPIQSVRDADRLLERVRQAEHAGASQVVTELLADKIYLDSELNKLRGEAVSR